jgi:8-oxo-dGTP pyrophosphatase MutT (NUDIX family)
MTTIRTALVDVYVLRGRGETLEALLLRRARDQVRGGTWEAVHGKIDGCETPVAAARRELREEIGCEPMALYNLSRVEQFYLHHDDEIALVPVFVAFVAADAVIHLSDEHDTLLWLSPEAATAQCTWPRAARALEDAVRMLGTGNAGLLEEILRIPPPPLPD